MKRGVARLWCLAVGLCLAPACSFGARFNVPSAEYAQYRRVKLEAGLEQRLRAGLVYLHSYPQGAFSTEVRAWFEDSEERLRVRAWNSLPRLNAYLRALPDSPHAELVRARAAELRASDRDRVLAETRLLEAAQERQQRLDQAESSRRKFQQELMLVVSKLAHFSDYGKPLDAGASDGLFGWFIAGDSPGVCEGDTCARTFRLEFDVPADGTLVQRTAAYDVRIELVRGQVHTLSLSGFALLDRLAESIFRRRIAQGDLQAHAEAIGQSVQFLALALHSELPEPECSAEAVSPTVLARHCRGKQATVNVGLDFTQADRIVFGAAPAP